MIRLPWRALRIRWMIRRDLPEVLGVERDSFDFCWTEEDFLRTLRTRNAVGVVAEVGQKVVGFLVYELRRGKLHILNFAVHRAARRARIGSQMISKLISKLSEHRRARITLELRESNLTAQLFFRSHQFRAVGVSRLFYEDSGEAAFLMEYRLGDGSCDGDEIDLQESVFNERF